MFELTRYLNNQLTSTRIFFDEKDAQEALEDAKDADDYGEPEFREITMEQFVQEARDAGCDDFGIFEMLLNTVDGYNEIERKALLCDKMIADRRRGANTINNVSSSERKARARKAAQARWKNIDKSA